MLSRIKVGDVRDFDCFVNAVIDEKLRFDQGIHLPGQENPPGEATGRRRRGRQEHGIFHPLIIETDDPHLTTMEEEIFGPVLTVHPYPDDRYEDTLKICDETSPYALTGFIFARDRAALVTACRILAVRGRQFLLQRQMPGPWSVFNLFGGSRASGTNDKGGSHNLMRWISPRTIKENYLPPADFPYPYMRAR